MRRALLSGGIASVAVIVLGLAAACGSSGDGTPSAQATTYADCLKQQGIDVSALSSGRPTAFPSGRPNGFPSGFPTARPDGSARPTARPDGSARPGGGNGGFFGNQPPAGVDAAKWQAAMQACSSLRPTGFGGQRGGGNNGAEAAYRTCLSNHGVTLTPNLATTDPKVAEALTACAPLKPAGQ